jgi:nitrogenase-associated protein
MAHITFYEKPGCGGNARQRALLLAAGHTLDVKSLLAELWTSERLLTFLAPLPVPDWFNRSAPRVKSGEVNPDAIDTPTALQLLLEDPLLIRRPLMESEGRQHVGFEPEAVDAWVGLNGFHADAAELACQGSDACHAPENT